MCVFVHTCRLHAILMPPFTQRGTVGGSVLFYLFILFIYFYPHAQTTRFHSWPHKVDIANPVLC